MKNLITILLTFFASLILFQTNAQIAGSLNFNGINNYIEIQNSPLNEIANGDFTFEAWIKGNESEQSDHPMIFSNRGDNPFDNGIALFFHQEWGNSQSKTLCIQVDASNHRLENNGTFNASILDNKCHHIAISRNGLILSFFVDGIFVGEKTPSTLGSIALNESLLIGKDKATNNTFNGTISQVRIWNTVRTESQINENKDIRLQGNESGLLAYWEMNNENDQIATDKTGSFDGILGNTVGIDDFDPSWTSEGCVEESLTSANHNLEQVFNLTPNPTFGMVNIEYQGNEDGQITITNQLGNILLTKTINNQTYNLDISNYSAGIYFLSINYKDQKIIKKIIKL